MTVLWKIDILAVHSIRCNWDIYVYCFLKCEQKAAEGSGRLPPAWVGYVQGQHVGQRGAGRDSGGNQDQGHWGNVKVIELEFSIYLE